MNLWTIYAFFEKKLLIIHKSLNLIVRSTTNKEIINYYYLLILKFNYRG